MGPVVWGSPVTSSAPGVYLVESAEPSDTAPIDPTVVAAWIKRVPTLLVDGRRPTAADLVSRLASFWIAGEPVVYVGMAGTSVAKRVRQFYSTPLGDPRPHAGGHWLKTLTTLATLRVWWAETDDPAADEDALLVTFGDRVSAKPGQNLVDPVLPFANRQTATGIRKVHGISGSTLDRGSRPPGLLPARSVSKTLASGTPAARPGTTRGSLAEINGALQAIACRHSDREVTAVEAAQELDRLGLLRDSPTRRGKPLRDLLRAGSIDFARQDGGRWWFIHCGQPDGQRLARLCPVGEDGQIASRPFRFGELVRRRTGGSADPWQLALVQRNVVWDEVRMARLLDSLLAGYPIGGLLVCRILHGGMVHAQTARNWRNVSSEQPRRLKRESLKTRSSGESWLLTGCCQVFRVAAWNR